MSRANDEAVVLKIIYGLVHPLQGESIAESSHMNGKSERSFKILFCNIIHSSMLAIFFRKVIFETTKQITVKL